MYYFLRRCNVPVIDSYIYLVLFFYTTRWYHRMAGSIRIQCYKPDEICQSNTESFKVGTNIF